MESKLEEFWENLKDFFKKEPITIIKKKKDREWYPLALTITQNGNQTKFLPLGHFTFDFPYEVESIMLRSSVNDLMPVLFGFEGILYPCITYKVESNTFVQKNLDKDYSRAYYSQNDVVFEYPFKLRLNSNWKFEVYACNEHTIAQRIYALINGWKFQREY